MVVQDRDICSFLIPAESCVDGARLRNMVGYGGLGHQFVDQQQSDHGIIAGDKICYDITLVS